MSKSKGNVAYAEPIARTRRRRCAALLPAARRALRPGRQFQPRRPAHALQQRPRQRPGQSRQPHAGHDRAAIAKAKSPRRKPAAIGEAEELARRCGHGSRAHRHRAIRRAILLARARSHLGGHRRRSMATLRRTSPGRWPTIPASARTWKRSCTMPPSRCAFWWRWLIPPCP